MLTLVSTIGGPLKALPREGFSKELSKKLYMFPKMYKLLGPDLYN
jgi:hypothetical protein